MVKSNVARRRGFTKADIIRILRKAAREDVLAALEELGIEAELAVDVDLLYALSVRVELALHDPNSSVIHFKNQSAGVIAVLSARVDQVASKRVPSAEDINRLKEAELNVRTWAANLVNEIDAIIDTGSEVELGEEALDEATIQDDRQTTIEDFI